MRKELTEEWKRVGIKDNDDFAILTNDITSAWSGLSIGNYKKLKGLRKENLRDNMTNLELVLNMLAEVTTREFSKKENPHRFDDSRNIAVRGGKVAGNARREIEEQIGEKVVTSKNSKEVIDLKEKRKWKELVDK